MWRLVVSCSICLTLVSAQQHPGYDFLSNFGLGNVLDGILNNVGGEAIPELAGRVEVRGRGSLSGGNYTFTAWTPFGACSKVCGGGSRARTRSCVNETGHEFTVNRCFSLMSPGTFDLYTLVQYGRETKEFDEELCNKHECRVSEWKLHESCSQKCGGGFMTYSRTCHDSQDQQDCNFQSTKLVSCNTSPCFRLGEWQEWSRCTAPCGGGRSSRKRTCEPNVPKFSPLYQELMYAMEHVSKPAVLRTIENESEIFYFSQYLSSCAALTVQTRFCNAGKCPSCPKNQVYHTCKPCTQVCKKVDMSNILDVEVKLPAIHLNPNGCGGVCVEGCGCPTLFPLLAQDGSCHAFDVMCPENRVTQSQQSYLLARLLSRRNSQAVAGNANLRPASTAPTTTTEVPPLTTSVAKPKQQCPKDIPIIDRDFCVCSGIMRDVPCVVGDSTKRCPFKCMDSPTCPNPLSPRLKSAIECQQIECSSDTQCGGGFLCCELLCGRRCIAHD